jgi:hypothetical protein
MPRSNSAAGVSVGRGSGSEGDVHVALWGKLNALEGWQSMERERSVETQGLTTIHRVRFICRSWR